MKQTTTVFGRPLRRSMPWALPPLGGLVAGVGLWLAALLLLLLADLLLLGAHTGGYRVPVGDYRDGFLLSDANDRQADGATPYRWTKASSTIWLRELSPAAGATLTLELGGRPEAAPVQLLLNGAPWASFTAGTAPRHVTLLLPAKLPAESSVVINSPTFQTPGDARQLGIKLLAFRVDFSDAQLRWPNPRQFGAQAILLGLALLATVPLGWRWRWRMVLLAALPPLLALLLGSQRLYTYAYLPRMVAAGALLLLLTWLLLPLAERKLAWMGGPAEVRLLWAITLLACLIRLSGVLYTTFASQDTGLNIDRVYRVLNGQIVIIKSSYEFANGETAHPPGIYLGMLPGILLFNDITALMHGFTAILDGSTTFLVAMLARRLGGNRTAGRLAAVLYLASYASFSILGYGFQKHIFGQWFTAPLALVLLGARQPPRPRQWLLALLLVLFSAFSHIGATLLNFTWMGLLGLLMLLAYRGISRSWLVGAGLTVAAALAAFALLYVDVFASSLGFVSSGAVEQLPGLFPHADQLVLKGLLLGYTEWGTLLLPFALWLIWRRGGLRQHLATVAWVATVLLFLLVDLRTGLQTRYFFFMLPLAFAAIGLLLGKLAAHGRAARLLCWALVVLVAVQNVALWYSITFADGKISMTPLTH